MTTKPFNEFHVIGLYVRTRNEDQHITNDIHNLWKKFMDQQTVNKIPNKTGDTIYGIYTDYENGADDYYKTIVGCKVSSLDTVPDGMIGITIKKGNYAKFIAKGDVTKDAIPNTWATIWKTDLDRKFTTDFEVYDDRAVNPTDAEVDIYIAVN